METNKIKGFIFNNSVLLIILLIVFIINYSTSHIYSSFSDILIGKILTKANGFISKDDISYFYYLTTLSYVVIYTFILNFILDKLGRKNEEAIYNLLIVQLFGIILIIIANIMGYLDINYIKKYIFILPFLSIILFFFQKTTTKVTVSNGLQNNEILDIEDKINKLRENENVVGLQPDFNINLNGDEIDKIKGVTPIDIGAVEDDIQKINLGEDLDTKDIKKIISLEREKEDQNERQELNQKGYIDLDSLDEDIGLPSDVDLLKDEEIYDSNFIKNENSLIIDEEDVDELQNYDIKKLFITGFQTQQEIESLEKLLPKL